MKVKLIIILALTAYVFSSCNDIIDRPSRSVNDDKYWTTEEKVRLYSTGFYGRFFAGYGYKYSTAYAAMSGYEFNDDLVTFGTQTDFERAIPNDRGSTSLSDTDPVWMSRYAGPTWNFAWVRKANIMIDRIENRMGDILTAEEKKHWTGLGRFFRAMEYAGLVTVFGDVPFFSKEVGSNEFDELYKPRTPRNTVMDEVYKDLRFALENVRLNDGDMNVNRYVVASYVARLALVEGTWQKYHYNNSDRAKKFLELSVEAANLVKQSGKYDIVTDFRTLFGSEDLKGVKDCIFYRHYDNGFGITHSVASNSSLSDSRNIGPSLSLIKSFICNDGKDWQTSTVAKAKDFTVAELIKTRDPRFEASFWDAPVAKSKGSLLYVCKFIDREGPTYAISGAIIPTKYTGTNNVNDYPVMRYAEVLLNWIEAKAELETLGAGAVGQSDIEESINKIRSRPLDAIAESKGVKQTAPMSLATLSIDPSRDASVPTLLWEIRRERRMELAFEHSRVIDLRRWKKLEYMDTNQYPDLLRGTWVDFPAELPDELKNSANVGVMAVTDMNGVTTVFNGTNGSKMVGFYSSPKNVGRQPFLGITNMNPYLAPVGTNNRTAYKQRGYVLDQTEGWSSAL